MEPNSNIYKNTLAAVREFITNDTPKVDDFDKTAQQVFAYQIQTNTAYRRFCASLPLNSVSHWSEIPALVTDAFKSSNLPTCLSDSEVSTTFMTSGTTGEVRGRHHFRDTVLYEHSILEAWSELKLPTQDKLLVLTPSPEEAPHSSLSHMMETVRRQYCPDAPYLIREDQLDPLPIIEACKSNTPVALLGTALAFLNLFETLEEPLKLPEGSWAMETGGYKGSGRTLTKEELYAQFEKYLGLAESKIWNEYSMTELSSQFYTKGIGAPHQAPHWMKIRVVNPETDKQVEAGEMGYLVIYDLANIDSVCAIRTQDLAIYHNEHSFTLIGRDPSALPRGCSRSIDDTLNN